MDTVPEVPKCFGVFPPKYATYLISIFGMGSGGCGLAGIVLYSLVEDSIIAHFVKDNKTDDTVKKVVLLTIGLNSLFLFCSNFLLFVGVLCKSSGSLVAGAWTIFVMCVVIIMAAMAAPLSCFFLPLTCVIKKLTNTLLFLGYMAVTVYLWLWLYFMVVVFNYLNAM